MKLPPFRTIYQSFRTPAEEKAISNAAAYKFCAFLLICTLMTTIRRKALQI